MLRNASHLEILKTYSGNMHPPLRIQLHEFCLGQKERRPQTLFLEYGYDSIPREWSDAYGRYLGK
jgi:hypothetical protein